MRIVFFGAGRFGLPTLRALAEHHDLALVVTQPDRPAGRRRKLTPTPIAAWAEDHDVPVLKPEKVNRVEVLDSVRAAEPDANVVVAFGQKVGDALVASPSFGRIATMNLHASLLPKYRGAAPINWAIIRGESVTGNTVFALVDRMDAGDVLGRQRTAIDPMETAGELHDRLAAMGPGLVLDVLDRLQRGGLDPEPQDDAQATLAPKLGRADAIVDFAATADEVRRRVHGLTPWPGVTCRWTAGRRAAPEPLILRRVASVPDLPHHERPGTVLEDGLIAAGQGAVRLLEVQPPGKRAMSWADYARGHDVPAGAIFESSAS